VLARQAGSVPWGDSVAGWLYAVARRLASEARVRAARRRRHERRAGRLSLEGRMAEGDGSELCAVLDEELNRLPPRYREPLLLCYWEGQTREQAARRLGLSARTLDRRLAEGRERLRGRLARRGLTLPAALLAAGIAQGAQPVVPALLVHPG